MSILYSILLGALQGVTEFLPVSSSGHLKVVQILFGLEEVPLLFDVFLHLASLLAVIIFFRKKIWNLLCVFGRMIVNPKNPKSNEEVQDRKTILAIVIVTIITGAIGIVTSKLIPDLPVHYVFIGFIITAFLLVFSSIIAKKYPGKAEGISWKQSIVIGIAQGIGTLPGISRSGSTISGAVVSGVDRSFAGEFSFIVSIPAILGAFVLELKDASEMTEMIGVLPIITGCIAAFIMGYLSLYLLMKIIKKGKLEWFAAYLIPLGICGLIFM